VLSTVAVLQLAAAAAALAFDNCAALAQLARATSRRASVREVGCVAIVDFAVADLHSADADAVDPLLHILASCSRQDEAIARLACEARALFCTACR
jgi:hypothetical protein